MVHSAAASLRTLAVLAAIAAAPIASGAPVGLVTDVDGNALQGGVPLKLLADLPTGAEVDVAAGGRVVVFYFGDGTEWTLAGPGRYRLAAKAPEAQRASPAPQRKAAPAAYRQFKLRTDRIAQGGTVMRGGEPAVLVAPVDEVVLAPDVRFAWQPTGAGAVYQFELVDDKGNRLVSNETSQTETRLPDGIRLASGRTYYWSLRGRESNGGPAFYRATEFRVADTATAQRVHAAAPKEGASFSERALYVALLEDVGAKSAARDARRALAQERAASWAPVR
ncbi:MAG TPA: hypothetical protein VII68_04000 [Casimicrobiaceae bacterium]|jgi:hypothetical protein